MSAPFDHLRSVPDSLRQKERGKKEAAERLRGTKYAAAQSIGPTVVGVLDNFRRNAFPQMRTHTQATEKESYYYWGIGFPAKAGDYEFFWTAVEVRPVFSPSGSVDTLETSLKVPNFAKFKELGGRFGLKYTPDRNGDQGGGATATTAIQHAPTEQGLTDALLKLFPQEHLKALLVELRDEWRVHG